MCETIFEQLLAELLNESYISNPLIFKQADLKQLEAALDEILSRIPPSEILEIPLEEEEDYEEELLDEAYESEDEPVMTSYHTNSISLSMERRGEHLSEAQTQEAQVGHRGHSALPKAKYPAFHSNWFIFQKI